MNTAVILLPVILTLFFYLASVISLFRLKELQHENIVRLYDVVHTEHK